MSPQPIHLSRLIEQPLVSILTPCYNASKYIAETIECVLAQTYTHWEMVICDDGSTDESVDIIETYASKDQRIRLIRQENAGAAAATNTAFEKSTGEIIAFLDADDLFVPKKLECCVNVFQKNLDSGFLTHRLEGIDAEGDKIGIIFPGVPKLVSGWFAPYLFDKVPTRGSAAPSAGNLVRREVIQKLMPIPLECQRTQDAYVLTAAMFLTPAIGLDQVLGSYRVHPAGQSRGVVYSEAYHLRRLEDQQSSANAVRGFCQSQGFEELVEYLRKEYYTQNVGYLENVVVYHLLTGKLPEHLQYQDVADLYQRAGKKGARFKPLLKLPVFARRWLLGGYRLAAQMSQPIRMKMRDNKPGSH